MPDKKCNDELKMTEEEEEKGFFVTLTAIPNLILAPCSAVI